MTGKENYRRAIEFKGPEYLPTGIGVSLDWLYDKDERKRERVKRLASRFPDDSVGWLTPTDFGESLGNVGGVNRWKDQWGTGWEDDGHGAKTEGYPLESGYEALAGYAFPDPLRPTRFDSAVERVRSGGAHVWMHLCGNITAILPDLIEIGLNVLNPVQPQAMDVRELSREFGGKVCFNGGVDVQGTLVRGTPEDVKREVHELVSLFGKFNGGYIGGTSHSVMPETPLNNVIAMYEAFAEYLPHGKGG